ncbi:MAG: hypothetical protein Hens3KO_18480 [Henriciella sp.]
MKTYELKTDETLKKYNYLWRMSRDRWAWEYLRRNKDFRNDAALHSSEDISVMTAPCRNTNIRLLRSRVPQILAARWGLIFMPGPDLNGVEADKARPAISGTVPFRIPKSLMSQTGPSESFFSFEAMAVWLRCGAPAKHCLV